MDVDVAPTQPFAYNSLAPVDDEFDLLHEDIAMMPAPANRKTMTFLGKVMIVMI
jgi:hypothetical protein